MPATASILHKPPPHPIHPAAVLTETAKAPSEVTAWQRLPDQSTFHLSLRVPTEPSPCAYALVPVTVTSSSTANNRWLSSRLLMLMLTARLSLGAQSTGGCIINTCRGSHSSQAMPLISANVQKMLTAILSNRQHAFHHQFCQSTNTLRRLMIL